MSSNFRKMKITVQLEICFYLYKSLTLCKISTYRYEFSVREFFTLFRDNL